MMLSPHLLEQTEGVVRLPAVHVNPGNGPVQLSIQPLLSPKTPSSHISGG